MAFERSSVVVVPDVNYLTRLTKVQKKGFERNSAGFKRTSIAEGDAETGGHTTLHHDYLYANANWAARLLLDLEKADSAYDKLNPSVLNSCNGLAFVNSNKGGLGLTFASGYGFVIRKLSQDQWGNSAWGQPLFFTISQAGLGVSAGWQNSQSAIAILAIGSMDVFKVGTTSMGTDLGLFSTDGALTGLGGAAMGGRVHMGMTVDQERSAFCYSKVDGLYLELSLHGTQVYPDKEANESLYGADYVPDDILNTAGGKYAEDMKPLIKSINELGRKAMHG